MLHFSKIYNLIERKTADKGMIPFDICYVKKDGTVRVYKNVICTSSHYRPASINIQTPAGGLKKLRCCGIISINGIEIFM